MSGHHENYKCNSKVNQHKDKRLLRNMAKWEAGSSLYKANEVALEAKVVLLGDTGNFDHHHCKFFEF